MNDNSPLPDAARSNATDGTASELAKIGSSANGDMKVGELLTRISEECESLAAVADQLHGFARMVAKHNQDEVVITSLQSLDRMTQYLLAFARIFGDCARSSGEDWKLDVKPTLDALSLSDLAGRLSGQPKVECGSAEFDLF